jgi:putative transposase
MKKSKFTEALIAFIPKQAEEGTPVAEVCRKAGISDATFYGWRKKYAGLMPAEMRRLRVLEEENGKLKKLVADLSLDKAMLQDVLSRKLQGLRGGAGWSMKSAGPLEVFDPSGMQRVADGDIDLPLQGQAPLAGHSREADQGDRRDAGALRLSPCPRAAEARGLGSERQADL